MAEKKDGKVVLKVDLNEQAKIILEKAQEKGVEHSFLFITTFQRYKEHITHLADLEKIIKEEGMLCKKEYVKGRANLYMNPAISAYNSTASAADKTAQLLIRYIVAPLKDADGDGDGDAFDLF
ncbi:MAG: hypothetical protein IJZ91_06385 [Oscillospiraceae bacterium]|nr:hypothetical protein [Oscillospiraceae bacterium]